MIFTFEIVHSDAAARRSSPQSHDAPLPNRDSVRSEYEIFEHAFAVFQPTKAATLSKVKALEDGLLVEINAIDEDAARDALESYLVSRNRLKAPLCLVATQIRERKTD